MFELSRKKSKPGTFYALAFCICLIAFILMCVGAFTPYWSQITEFDGTNEVSYHKGLIVTCDIPDTGGCTSDTSYGNHSEELLASFIMMIFAIILAFLTLQLFVVGQCVRSCREKNLGVSLTVMTLVIAIYLVASLAFFEVSITNETTPGFTHQTDTFGFSRGLVVGAIVLYAISSFFTLGEYFKRRRVVSSHCRGEQQRSRPSGIFTLRSNQHPNPTTNSPNNKRPSQTDGDPSHNDDVYFRTRARRGPNVVNRLSICGGPSTFPLPPPYLNRPRTPSDCTVGGMKTCGRLNCLICSYVMETRKFWGPEGVFNIKHYLDCTSRNIVYAIICLKDDTVFIGHTPTDCAVEHIFHTHLLNIQGFNLADPVAAHFTKPGHSFLDAKVTCLAPTKCDQATRNRMEKTFCYNMDKPHNSYHGVNKSFIFL